MAQKPKKGFPAEGVVTFYLTLMNDEHFLMLNKKFAKDKNYFLFILAPSALHTSEVQLIVTDLMISKRVTNAPKWMAFGQHLVFLKVFQSITRFTTQYPFLINNENSRLVQV